VDISHFGTPSFGMESLFASTVILLTIMNDNLLHLLKIIIFANPRNDLTHYNEF
jgi:hypothetical protein